MKKQAGFVLFITLIFIFVLTLIVISGSQTMILDTQMQNNSRHDFQVYVRAYVGMQFVAHRLEGDPITLPDSALSLNTTVKNVQTDQCGNQTVEIQSIAQDRFSKVILNSRDIFAKVPREKGCKEMPLHQRIWWQES
ncbi:MAG: hypothetical protein A3F13_05110 [Gammaproteobacteria bacterium RIFCSPHIGHO2_12_FULL_40_19]|nr:MAG: hypothetical protein A3F13_05110 [Gammaproteobacteria bacterium RIFCSPHIGHO2_12_FULL_40_19]